MTRSFITLVTLATLIGACDGASPVSTTQPQAITTVTAPKTTRVETTKVTTTSTVPTSEEDRFDASGLFEIVSNDPAIPNGPIGAWDSQYTDPGAIVSHEGTIHVLQNGFVGWPAAVGVGHWTSTDGTQWTEESDDPVFDGTSVQYAGVTALASSLVVEDDETWTLYFYTWDDTTWPLSRSSIGRATAPDPDGPWSVDPEPVLTPGSAGSWDDFAVRSPSVVKNDSGYLMWYTGATDSQAMIGLATSDDGIAWVKHDDPATTDQAFAESDPVIQPSGPNGPTWDQPNVHQPRVAPTPSGYVMLYTGVNTVSSSGRVVQKHGLAVSPDGLTWTRSSDEAIAASAIPGGRNIWFTGLLNHEGTLYLFFELGVGNETSVYLATTPVSNLPQP